MDAWIPSGYRPVPVSAFLQTINQQHTKGIAMKKSYRVTWTIDVDAHGPREAAAKALEIQRDPDSIATVFNVVHTQEVKSTIDLGHDTKPKVG
jgi:hypothetical protein